MSVPHRPNVQDVVRPQASLQVPEHHAPPPWSASELQTPQETGLEWLENGAGLLRRQVLPPNSFGARIPEGLFAGGAGSSSQDEIIDSMNAGEYYTNLLTSQLSGNVEAHNSQRADEAVPKAQTAAPVKGHQKRSKNFSDEEDILLVSAWLNVTMDPIQGVDQSRSTYWNRIHKYFHAHKNFESNRSQSSLTNRWCGIQHDVNVFAGCLSKIEARNHSGWSIDDKHANACAMFKAEDKQHRNFPYMHCWKILKDQPKWMDKRKHVEATKHVTKKQKITANSTSAVTPSVVNVDESELPESVLERPAGKKKEKQKLSQRCSVEAFEYIFEKKKEVELEKDLRKEERCKQAFALQEERSKKALELEAEKFRFEKEKFEFQRQLEEDRIMNLDLSTLSYNQQKYYEGRQREILARRECN